MYPGVQGIFVGHHSEVSKLVLVRYFAFFSSSSSSIFIALVPSLFAPFVLLLVKKRNSLSNASRKSTEEQL